MADSGPFVRIRWRAAEEPQTRRAPFVLSGRLIALTGTAEQEEVVMRVGPRTPAFFVADFAALFEGLAHARRLLRDAVQHQDFVEIQVQRERLCYRNEAQYARVVEAFPDGG